MTSEADPPATEETPLADTVDNTLRLFPGDDGSDDPPKTDALFLLLIKYEHASPLAIPGLPYAEALSFRNEVVVGIQEEQDLVHIKSSRSPVIDAWVSVNDVVEASVIEMVKQPPQGSSF